MVERDSRDPAKLMADTTIILSKAFPRRRDGKVGVAELEIAMRLSSELAGSRIEDARARYFTERAEEKSNPLRH